MSRVPTPAETVERFNAEFPVGSKVTYVVGGRYCITHVKAAAYVDKDGRSMCKLAAIRGPVSVWAIQEFPRRESQ